MLPGLNPRVIFGAILDPLSCVHRSHSHSSSLLDGECKNERVGEKSAEWVISCGDIGPLLASVRNERIAGAAAGGGDSFSVSEKYSTRSASTSRACKSCLNSLQCGRQRGYFETISFRSTEASKCVLYEPLKHTLST